MKYAVEMGSVAMIYTSSFIKIGSAIQELVGGTHRHTNIQRAWKSDKPTFLFLNKESRLKKLF
jgi:hypothetical protein